MYPALGTLYVARDPAAPSFTRIDDEEVARMYAAHAAMVVENDRL